MKIERSSIVVFQKFFVGLNWQSGQLDMTYLEAETKKIQLGKTTHEDSWRSYQILITPASESDFRRYSEDYRVSSKTFNDETAKNYCKDGHYRVRGMWADGKIVLSVNSI
jgi:hypothetical protein